MKTMLVLLCLFFISPVKAQSPTVSVWQPANGAVLDGNMWTTLSSGATNAASVTYFVNNLYHCQVTNFPYNCGWFTPPTGTHTIRAVARSWSGAEVSQSLSITIRGTAPSTPAPTVSLWQPDNGSSFQPAFWTTLSAGAENATSVTWYVNGAHYCVSYSSPYNCGWQAPNAAGTYVLKVVARNASGQSAERSVTVSVSAPVPPPTVSLYQPSANAVFSPEMWTTLSAGATNASSVAWYVNGSEHCVVNASPYNCSWKVPVSGTHTIKVVARNSVGVSAERSVSVSVKSLAPAPTVSLWQPSNGASLSPDFWTTLSAGAENATSVTYYVNGVEHCVVTASPYNCGWKTPSSSGNVTIRVVAKNIDGVTAEKSAVVSVGGSVTTPTPTPTPTPVPSTNLTAGVPYIYALPPLTGYQGKALSVTYQFGGKSISHDLIAFVYYQDINGQTVIQDDFTPSPGSSGWNGNLTFTRTINIPTTFLKGTYKIIAGLYKNENGWPKVTAVPGPGVTTIVPNTVFEIGTLNVPNDPPPIAPTIGITFPVNNMILLNNANMNFNVTSDKAARVDMYLNDELLCSDSSAPFSCPFTTPSENSDFKLVATAIGPTNLSSTSEISFKVSSSAPAVQAPGPQVPSGYTLYFNDEFENRHNGAPNPNFWDYRIDYVINEEAQCYTDNRRENVRVEHRNSEGYTNGYLVLQLRKELYPCKQDQNKTYQYTSGGIATRKRGWGNFLKDMPHGRYEIRVKIPSGRGTWPAIWLLGDSSLGSWPNSGEIDIMEAVGYEEARGFYASYSTLHRNSGVGMWPNKWGTTGQGHVYLHPTPLSQDFHTWALEWTPDSLKFYIDGKIINRRVVVGDRIEIHDSFNRSEFEGTATALGWPFSRETEGHQYMLILNLAYGGKWGGLEGLDDSIFARGDVEMLVDYVRVYKKN